MDWSFELPNLTNTFILSHYSPLSQKLKDDLYLVKCTNLDYEKVIITKIVFTVNNIKDFTLKIQSGFIEFFTDYEIKKVNELILVTFDFTKIIKHVSNKDFDGLYKGANSFDFIFNSEINSCYIYYKIFNQNYYNNNIFTQPKTRDHIPYYWTITNSITQEYQIASSVNTVRIDNIHCYKLVKIELYDININWLNVKIGIGNSCYDLFESTPAELFFDNNKYTIDINDYCNYRDVYLNIQSDKRKNIKIKHYYEIEMFVKDNSLIPCVSC